LYTDWVAGKKDAERIVQKKQQVIQLWKDAGLANGGLPIIEDVGFGQLRTMTVDLFLNFPQKHREDIVVMTASFFHEAIGVYKKRLFDTINPFEWLIFLTRMPEVALKSAGLEPKKWVAQILNVIWQFVFVIGTIIITSYSNQIIKSFEKLIGIQ